MDIALNIIYWTWFKISLSKVSHVHWIFCQEWYDSHKWCIIVVLKFRSSSVFYLVTAWKFFEISLAYKIRLFTFSIIMLKDHWEYVMVLDATRIKRYRLKRTLSLKCPWNISSFNLFIKLKIIVYSKEEKNIR